MKTPTLYLMLGYPGSGKTTAAKAICKLTGAEHLWADLERKRMFDRPTFSWDETKKLYPVLDKKLEQLLAENKSVVYDTNFNFYKDRLRMKQLAGRYGAQTLVVWVQTPKKLAFERATQDRQDTTTRVLQAMPPEHFERMAKNLQPPRPDEKTILVDGATNAESNLQKALNLGLG